MAPPSQVKIQTWLHREAGMEVSTVGTVPDAGSSAVQMPSAHGWGGTFLLAVIKAKDSAACPCSCWCWEDTAEQGSESAPQGTTGTCPGDPTVSMCKFCGL